MSCRSTLIYIRSKSAVVGALVALALSITIPTSADAAPDKEARKIVRCKSQIVKSLQQLAGRHQLARGLCADWQAAGVVNGSIDCMADPIPLGGPGIGVPAIDNRFERIDRKVRRDGVRIGNNCASPTRTPRTLGFDTLCPNPDDAAADWTKMIECGYDIVRASADRLQALVYRPPGSTTPIDPAEMACRTALGGSLRGALRGRMAQRAACFRRVNRGELGLNCLATSAWPGKTLPTGASRADREMREQMMTLRDSAALFCSFDLTAADFTGSVDIDDPTGGVAFTDEDLFHELADSVIMESTRVAAAMYPGFPYCGDGIADIGFGEECDDGIDNLVGCDGCDRDCTLPACNNGSACAPESCDDGNTTLGDGCDSGCQFEACGDGIMQPDLGETCDDANTVDCDGCDSNCTPSDLCNNGVECASTGEECDLGLGVCVEGLRELTACVDDGDCAACMAGPDTGATCAINADCGTDETGAEYECAAARCGGICAGGLNDEDLCLVDADCAGECVSAYGVGRFCLNDFGCPPGLFCNNSQTCVLPGAGEICSVDDDCAFGGVCSLSTGCMGGNSDTRPDLCRDNCMLPSCGDGTVDTVSDANVYGVEQCDDANLVDDDGCDSNCTITSCGNGILNEGEECDLGPGICLGGFDDASRCLAQADCRGRCFELVDRACTEEDAAVVCEGFSCLLSAGCFGGNVDGITCRSDCTIPRCGDGIVDLNEDCDDGMGTCVAGLDDGEECTLATDCRGLCTTGPNTGTGCFSDADCGGAPCELGSCEGGNSDVVPGACPTSCTLLGP